MKKLNLSELKVESFITSVPYKDMQLGNRGKASHRPRICTDGIDCPCDDEDSHVRCSH